ncbi:3-phosphoshikimate 1-carboxyvinyltransferase, partial [Rhizobium ruizarguesonis]
GRFQADSIRIDGGRSSQYGSALRMRATGGDRPFDIELVGEDIGARGYIDLTTAAMNAFGAKVDKTSPVTWRVEPTG